MQTITTIGLDIAKSVFQVHGVDNDGKVVIRRQLRGQVFPFDLTSTSALLPALVRCVQQVNAGGIKSVGNFSAPSQSSSAQATVAVNAGSTLKPENNQPQSAELQLEAVELASNFLIKAELHNARILSRAETPAELASIMVLNGNQKKP
jgi:hypothetical protein